MHDPPMLHGDIANYMYIGTDPYSCSRAIAVLQL